MHVSTDLPTLSTLEGFAPGTRVLRRPRSGTARMPAPATHGNAPEPVVAVPHAGAPSPVTARASRLHAVGRLVLKVVDVALATVRRVHGRYRQRCRAKAAYDALRQFDDHMLRDLGFQRSELASVVGELSSRSAHDRVRDFTSFDDLPK